MTQLALPETNVSFLRQRWRLWWRQTLSPSVFWLGGGEEGKFELHRMEGLWTSQNRPDGSDSNTLGKCLGHLVIYLIQFYRTLLELNTQLNEYIIQLGTEKRLLKRPKMGRDYGWFNHFLPDFSLPEKDNGIKKHHGSFARSFLWLKLKKLLGSAYWSILSTSGSNFIFYAYISWGVRHSVNIQATEAFPAFRTSKTTELFEQMLGDLIICWLMPRDLPHLVSHPLCRFLVLEPDVGCDSGCGFKLSWGTFQIHHV